MVVQIYIVGVDAYIDPKRRADEGIRPYETIYEMEIPDILQLRCVGDAAPYKRVNKTVGDGLPDVPKKPDRRGQKSL